MIEFFIPASPIGKGRPQFARRGDRVVTFTPEKTRLAEHEIRYIAKQLLEDNRELPYQGAISLLLTITFPRPKAAKKRKHHTSKPDVDNVLKLLCDALNGILWIDDSQINLVCVRKEYAHPATPTGDIGYTVTVFPSA